MEKICKVTKDHSSPFPDPLILKKGDKLSYQKKKTEWPGWIWCVTEKGKGGWIPEDYTEKTDDGYRMLTDYDATELNARVGEKLTILLEESGWALCLDRDNKKGWIPLENVTKL